MSVALDTTGWGTAAQRKQLLESLTFEIQPDPKYAAQVVEVYAILRDKRSFICPFAVGQRPEYKPLQQPSSVSTTWITQPSPEPALTKSGKSRKVKVVTRSVVQPVPVFLGALFPNQVSIHHEAWAHLHNAVDGGHVLLEVSTGAGKTEISIHMGYRLYMERHPTGPLTKVDPSSPQPTQALIDQCRATTTDPLPPIITQEEPFVVLVVIHRSELERQWIETIQERLMGSASVQVLNRKDPLKASPYPIKFLLINTVNIEHRWTPERPFHCSLLLLDEAHTVATDNGILRMLSVRPKWVVAMTATPDRSDGRSKALDMITSHRVVRKMRRLFTVYSYHTPWRCRVTSNPITGELDWNIIMEAQATHPRRNQLVAEFVLLYWTAGRSIMVLCKRVEQVMLLQVALQSVRGQWVSSETLVGGQGLATNRRPGEERPRVLLSTYSMAGVGFSDSRLDTLVLAADVEQMTLQYAGRIFRRPDVSPIIVDITDPHVPGMKKHFRSRSMVYQQMGGYVVPFDGSDLPIDLW
jgi:hypothetical protein